MLEIVSRKGKSRGTKEFVGRRGAPQEVLETCSLECAADLMTSDSSETCSLECAAELMTSDSLAPLKILETRAPSSSSDQGVIINWVQDVVISILQDSASCARLRDSHRLAELFAQIGYAGKI